MAKEIKTYRVSRFADGRVFLGLTFVDGTYWTFQAQGSEDAALLLDILRNEHPVFVDEHGTVYTGPEPVGENDPSRGQPPG